MRCEASWSQHHFLLHKRSGSAIMHLRRNPSLKSMSSETIWRASGLKFLEQKSRHGERYAVGLSTPPQATRNKLPQCVASEK